jgi:hypothetical protein
MKLLILLIIPSLIVILVPYTPNRKQFPLKKNRTFTVINWFEAIAEFANFQAVILQESLSALICGSNKKTRSEVRKLR